ncbi:hypothetical protein [Micromonospora sp. NPDC023956]|uniref:hypothetical protein n=1 Tax=Micromonospora sp. NPDC023956 TaxID=3155722 RepID=UPI003411796A
MTRQPILTRALIVSALGLVYAVLAHFGVELPPEIKDRFEEFAVVAAPLAVAYWSRRHTTPVADPRAEDGRPLEPTPASPDATAEDAPAGSPPDAPPASEEPASEAPATARGVARVPRHARP